MMKSFVVLLFQEYGGEWVRIFVSGKTMPVSLIISVRFSDNKKAVLYKYGR